MRVWVDVDSCARDAREVVARAAQKRSVEVIMVGDRAVPEARRRGILAVVVEAGEDAADRHIAERVEANDLVVTRDLLFAENLTAQGLTVLNDQGDVFTAENIAERRSIRDFMYEMRRNGDPARPAAGRITGADRRSRNRGKQDLQSFANAFDRELTKRLNSD